MFSISINTIKTYTPDKLKLHNKSVTLNNRNKETQFYTTQHKKGSFRTYASHHPLQYNSIVQPVWCTEQLETARMEKRDYIMRAVNKTE